MECSGVVAVAVVVALIVAQRSLVEWSVVLWNCSCSCRCRCGCSGTVEVYSVVVVYR